MNTSTNNQPLYIITGTVVRGWGMGKLAGTPTAGLKTGNGQELPPDGVYAAGIVLGSREYPGVAHVGPRPVLGGGREFSIETHIFDFDMELYGKDIELRLYEKFHGTQEFNDLPSLTAQIRKDCLAARGFWGLKQTPVHLTVDAQRRCAVIDGLEIPLSRKEFDLLYLLSRSPDKVFTKEQIYEAVWRESANGYCHAVENTVFQIRKRLRPYSRGHDFIKTVVGHGYKFNLSI